MKARKDTDLKIKALAPWFGGKRTLAPEIVRELGPHTQYFEPCCGSMAVLFAKKPSQKETVNDLHGDLVNLARVVANPIDGPILYDRLQRVLFCESLLLEAREKLVGGELDPDGIDRAYWYFIGSWMGRNGTAGTARIDYQLAVRWTKSGGSPTVRWKNALESMPAWHHRLKNVVVMSRDERARIVGKIPCDGGWSGSEQNLSIGVEGTVVNVDFRDGSFIYQFRPDVQTWRDRDGEYKTRESYTTYMLWGKWLHPLNGATS